MQFFAWKRILILKTYLEMTLHTSIRQSFKKVTCPINIKHCISGRESEAVHQAQKAEDHGAEV